MGKLRSVLFMTAVLLWTAASSEAIEDRYETGGEHVRFNEVGSEETEIYKKRVEGLGVAEHLFSPGYQPSDPDPFWDRVNKQAPTPTTVIHSLWANPKHLVWDTPINMGTTLKNSYYDTLSESDSGMEIGQDYLTGLPNTFMVGANGFWDSASNFYTDVWAPAIGSVFIWPPRYLTGLTQGAPDVYNVVDVLPKVLWSVALPVRKTGIAVGEQAQKGVNFLYRTLTHPTRARDHLEKYWGPQDEEYSSQPYIPGNPRSTSEWRGGSGRSSQTTPTASPGADRGRYSVDGGR